MDPSLLNFRINKMRKQNRIRRMEAAELAKRKLLEKLYSITSKSNRVMSRQL